jgi:hypothetical protein
MDDNSSVIVTKNNNSISNSMIESNNLEDIFSVFEKAKSIYEDELKYTLSNLVIILSNTFLLKIIIFSFIS